MTTTVAVPEAVMERVHAELTRAFLETPDYINKVVAELLKEPGRYNSYGNDPDYQKPLFERLLRQELRSMIERSMLAALREKYQTVVDAAVAAEMDRHEGIEGSLAQAFAKAIAEDWRVKIETKFSINKGDD